jgi:hypothetical protein
VKRVVDADTLDFYLDRGFMDYTVKRIRLLDVHGPEVKAGCTLADVAAVKGCVMSWLNNLNNLLAYPLIVRTYEDKTPQPTGDASAGRWLGTVYPLSYTEPARSLNAAICGFMLEHNIRPGW